MTAVSLSDFYSSQWTVLAVKARSHKPARSPPLAGSLQLQLELDFPEPYRRGLKNGTLPNAPPEKRSGPPRVLIGLGTVLLAGTLLFWMAFIRATRQ